MLNNPDNPIPSAPRASGTQPDFLNVKQLADYLNINERKVYQLVNDGSLPGTRATGKWLFPRELIDRWLLESSHGGVLTDRLLVCGSDCGLVHQAVSDQGQESNHRTLISFTPMPALMSLNMLEKQRCEAAIVNWGRSDQCHIRHPALLKRFVTHKQWVLIHLFTAEQGLVVKRGHDVASLESLLRSRVTWALPVDGSGSLSLFDDTINGVGCDRGKLNVVHRYVSERQGCAAVGAGRADTALVGRGAAQEFGFDFIPIGSSTFEAVTTRNVFFRTLFQQFLASLQTATDGGSSRPDGVDSGGIGNISWSDQTF